MRDGHKRFTRSTAVAAATAPARPIIPASMAGSLHDLDLEWRDWLAKQRQAT